MPVSRGALCIGDIVLESVVAVSTSDSPRRVAHVEL